MSSTATAQTGKTEKAVKTAISPTRAENYADWYQAVISAADMAENSGVRGCMVIKPWGYGIWERLARELDDRFKATGHENAYFPLFIPLSLIEKEATHVEGFAKEMAVVTHHRLVQKDGKLVPDGELEEPLVIRPTSETIIGEAFARWIESYRDLPVLINQWANVVRWEMRTRLFLRTTEFLWQEGHTAHADRDDAMRETLQMLEVYRDVAENVMAMPVIKGEKTPGERFPGAVNTYCIEAMMQDGKALQAGTSHYLGQNFSKAADIKFQTKDGGLDHVHTTSWGVSTRLIGGLIMTHGDDNGMKVPPKLAPFQVVIVPIIRADSDRDAVMAYADRVAKQLGATTAFGEKVRVKLDGRDVQSQDKRWQWIKKGVPLILEIGPKDVASGQVCAVWRDDIGKKNFVATDALAASIGQDLGAYQQRLFDAAKALQKSRMVTNIKTRAELEAYFSSSGDQGYSTGKGFVLAPFCGDESAAEPVLKALGITLRCAPFDTPVTGPCIITGGKATMEVILARSY
ncbi:MAG: proline--tRNA ligase [Pseudomonadota bacterium]|nr:proline--tRNA ligase [Pseudomonadota bacterium]